MKEEYSVNDIIQKDMFLWNKEIAAERLYGFKADLNLKLGKVNNKYNKKNAGIIAVDIIGNIVSNAIWAITGVKDYDEIEKKRKKHGKISIKTYHKSGFDHVEVKDNGIGIEKSKIHKVFEKGYSIKGDKGLGLYYAKKYAKRFGGDVMVSSVSGKGSTFIIKLGHSRKSHFVRVSSFKS